MKTRLIVFRSFFIFVYTVQKSKISTRYTIGYKSKGFYRIFYGPVILGVFEYTPHHHDLDLESSWRFLNNERIL